MSLAVAVLLVISMVPAAAAGSAAPGADPYETNGDRALESLAGRVVDDNHFLVRNDGDVPARVTHVVYRGDGVDFVDVPDADLIPNEGATLGIDNRDYFRLGVLSARGLVYPISGPGGFDGEDENGTVIGGRTEPGAPVTVVVRSEKRVFPTYADENGRFLVTIENLSEGNHSVEVIAGDANRNERADGPQTGGWRGYAEKSVENGLSAGDREFFRLPLTYDPFRLELSDSSGSLSRGWSQTGGSWVEVSPGSPSVESWSRYSTLDPDRNHWRSEYDWAEGWRTSELTETHSVSYTRPRYGWRYEGTSGWKEVSKRKYNGVRVGDTTVADDGRSDVTRYVYAVDEAPLDGSSDYVSEVGHDYGEEWHMRDDSVGYRADSYTYKRGDADKTRVTKKRKSREKVDTDYRYHGRVHDRKWKYHVTGFGGVDKIEWYDTEQSGNDYTYYELLETRWVTSDRGSYVDPAYRGSSYRVHSRSDADQYTEYVLTERIDVRETVYGLKEASYTWGQVRSGGATRGHYDILTGYSVERARYRRTDTYTERAHYARDGWEDKRTTVTVVPRNNYGEDVRLRTDRSFASLSDGVVTPQSPASSTLVASPPDHLSDGTSSIGIAGLASESAMENWSAEGTYTLDLNTARRPDGILDTWTESETWLAPEPESDRVKLTVNVDGPGSAGVASRNVTVHDSWSDEYVEGVTESLIANPDSGATFDRWTDGEGRTVARRREISVVVASSTERVAHFEERSEEGIEISAADTALDAVIYRNESEWSEFAITSENYEGDVRIETRSFDPGIEVRSDEQDIHFSGSGERAVKIRLYKFWFNVQEITGSDTHWDRYVYSTSNDISEEEGYSYPLKIVRSQVGYIVVKGDGVEDEIKVTARQYDVA